MNFHPIEVPIAISMIELAEQASHPFQKYFSFWAAFNNIYTVIGQRQGLIVRPDLDGNKQQKTEQRWGYTFLRVKPPSEKRQITEAINQLDAQTKDVISKHPNIRFFVERTPAGVNSNRDSLGQI